MPFVQVKVIEGVFSPEEKRQMLERVTDAMVSVEGENMRQVTWVVVKEVAGGDWAIAGRPLEADDVLAARSPS